MHYLGGFSFRDMVECTARLRRLGQGAGSMEEAAGRIVTYLYDDFADRHSGQRACALVRFYKTHPYGLLDAPRRRLASARLAEAPSPSARYFTLLATTGDESAWPSILGSPDRMSIPLEGAEGAASAARGPMLMSLVTQLGLDLGARVPPAPPAVDLRTLNVFHIPDAADSLGVPSHNAFVSRHGIRSVLGFGGLLPAGDLFAVVLFTRVLIGAEARDLFKPLALAVKLGVMAFADGPIFS